MKRTEAELGRLATDFRGQDTDQVESQLKAMTMAELKVIASELNLKVGGNKASAVSTIVSHYRYGEVRRMMSERKTRSLWTV